MNNQFEQIYEQSIRLNFEQSIWTELSIWRETATNNLNKFIKNFVKKTIYINHFEEKYQHSTWNKNYQQSIFNRNINIRFEQGYLEFILKKKQIITIVLSDSSTLNLHRKINNLVWTEKTAKNLNRNINNQFLTKISTVTLKK